MLRFFISAVALAGILALQHPAMADPVAAAASDHAQVAATAMEQPAPLPVQASTSDLTAPATAGLGKDAITVGFGWG